MDKQDYDQITEKIIGASMVVHAAIGPGRLESVYEACLAFELTGKGFKVERQKELQLVYKSVKLDCVYRLDLLIDELVIVEIKSVDCLLPIHQAQLISYLKLADKRLGLLINFNVKYLATASEESSMIFLILRVLCELSG
jgi:GxxExxY protein